MDIIFYHPNGDEEGWVKGLEQRLPTAKVRLWQPSDTQLADYAVLWRPPMKMLQDRTGLKGIFALGAGVDALMDMLHAHPELVHESVPLVRLEDTGMGEQMVEYALAAVLRYYRRLDEYADLQRQGLWRELEIVEKRDFTIGIAGTGVLGSKIALALAALGFPVHCWSQSEKSLAGVSCFAGVRQRNDFLTGLQLLINVLPNTPQTRGYLNADLFRRLNQGAYIINIARGAHLIEQDLIDALIQKQLKAATLDVCQQEPLPVSHPFWRLSAITLTPHIAATTQPGLALDSIANNIRRIENGERPIGQVDRQKGY